MIASVTCHNCKCAGLYGQGSLQREDLAGHGIIYFVECRFCNHYTGTEIELRSLIANVPDYEPDEDALYEAVYEIAVSK